MKRSLFGLKSPYLTANSIKCLKSPCSTMKLGQTFKKSPRKRIGFQFSELRWVATFDGTDTTGTQVWLGDSYNGFARRLSVDSVCTQGLCKKIESR